MSLLDWFDAKPAKAFGSKLAETFALSMPLEANLPDRKFSHKAEAALKKMNRMVGEFKGANKLNVYKKAQLGNSFKWALKDARYEQVYIDRLTEWLVERL